MHHTHVVIGMPHKHGLVEHPNRFLELNYRHLPFSTRSDLAMCL